MSGVVGLVRPEALPLLGLVAVLALIGVWAEFRRRRALLAFAGRGSDLSSVSEARRRVKLALLLAALGLAVVGLAGPYIDVVEREVVQSGVDLVVALDVSQSMGVRDVEPDRLRAAKAFIERLGDDLTRSRVALVLYAGQAVQRYPSTADPSVLGRALDSIGGGFKPQEGGSSLAAGIAAALEAFPEDARESARSKAIVLVGDGEDISGQAPDLAPLTASNTRLFTVGIGTPAGGPVPAYDAFGGFLRYLTLSDGRQVISRLDEGALRGLAEATGGQYFRFTTEISTSNAVVAELHRLDASELGDAPGGSVPDDLYQIFLALAVAALIVEELVNERRRMPQPRSLRTPRTRPRFRVPRPAFGRAPSIAILLACAMASSSCTESRAGDADRLYLAGDYEGALAIYRELITGSPGIVELRVNAANALHQLGRYEEALPGYEEAIRQGETPVVAVAHYQTGNTLFRQGALEEAREAYKEALLRDPNDRDAKFNIEVIDRLLSEPDEGQPQPGSGGGPAASAEAGEGSPPPGASGAPGPAQSPQPGEEEPATPGDDPPQTSTGGAAAPDLSDVLEDFRSELTVAQALRLLDALLADQQGIEFLLEGNERPGEQEDPTY